MTVRLHLPLLAALLATSLLAAACGDAGGDAAPVDEAANNDDDGKGGKTDVPDDPADLSCDKRQADAFDSNQDIFDVDAVRWSCADVEGVNNNNQDDRGQEYCEFFAVVLPPPEVDGDEERPDPVEVGRITSADYRDDGSLGIETTDLSIDFNDDQIFYMEDYPEEILGQCVFTSWHSDVPGPVPACAEDGAEGCPDVLGLAIEQERFRMKMPVNSNEAAWDLLNQCLALPEAGDPEDPEDPRHSDFYRACLLTADLFGTEWRRSDPAICAAATRMAECGCGLVDGGDVAETLIPAQPTGEDAPAPADITLRGFPLGGWSAIDALPAGCRYVDLGDGSQTVVTCDLTASDVLDNKSDLKRRCIDKYANDVVVYVPIPSEAITCDPPEGGQYADTCSDTPWVVTPSP